MPKKTQKNNSTHSDTRKRQRYTISREVYAPLTQRGALPFMECLALQIDRCRTAAMVGVSCLVSQPLLSPRGNLLVDLRQVLENAVRL